MNRVRLLAFLSSIFFWHPTIHAQVSDTLQYDPLIGTSIDSRPRTQTVLENLGPMINSPYDESAPVISLDGNTLYFWSTRPDGYGFQDIYVSHVDSVTGAWTQARNIGKTVNNSGPNIVLSITPEGRKLLIYRENKKNAQPGFSDLAIVRKSYDGWSSPVQIKIDEFVNQAGSALTAYLGVDGRTLVLSFKDSDSQGEEDLYISFMNKETKAFSKPRNLGNINSSYAEITPFLAPDNITLYFSSDRPGGLGGYDIYMTQRLDSTWRNWSPPVNLGPSVNTEGDDLHFKFPAAADFGYLVSTGAADTNFGGRDIYTVTIPSEVRPKAVTIVAGKVIDRATEKPLSAKITYIRLPDGKDMGTTFSDEETGEYRIILPTGHNYAVLAEGEGYIAISENLNTRGIQAFTEVERNLYLAPMVVGEVIRLNNLFFDLGSATLHPDSYPEIERLSLILRKHPSLVIEVAGHTDNIGDEAFNIQLSQKRAAQVIDVLIKNGIESSRLTSKGYGSSRPVADNRTPEGRQLNRRVELIIQSL
jgi:outer membrane protein OmpA-like peptidoglycan-associated protein